MEMGVPLLTGGGVGEAPLDSYDTDLTTILLPDPARPGPNGVHSSRVGGFDLIIWLLRKPDKANGVIIITLLGLE